MNIPIIGEEDKKQEEMQMLMNGVKYIATEQQQLKTLLGQTMKVLDINTLTIRMLVDVLVDKKVVTEEEVQSLVKEKVLDEYEAMEKRAAEESQKKMEELQKQMKDEVARNTDLSNRAIKEAQENFQKNRKK